MGFVHAHSACGASSVAPIGHLQPCCLLTGCYLEEGGGLARSLQATRPGMETQTPPLLQARRGQGPCRPPRARHLVPKSDTSPKVMRPRPCSQGV